MEKHLDTLEAGVKDLTANWKRLGDDPELQEFLKIIRRPGWTTPAELRFSEGLVKSMQEQTKVLAGLTNTLLAGARLVGTK